MPPSKRIEPIRLLDVNALLAITRRGHLHHEAAHAWLDTLPVGSTWATCPITENGFVRIASHPSYPNRPGDAAVVLAILREFCAAEGHRFWSADVSIRAVLRPGAVITC